MGATAVALMFHEGEGLLHGGQSPVRIAGKFVIIVGFDPGSDPANGHDIAPATLPHKASYLIGYG